MTIIYCSSLSCEYNKQEKEEDIYGICTLKEMHYDDICLDENTKDREVI